MTRKARFWAVAGLAVMLAGCFTAQQWFQLIGGLLPIVVQTFTGLTAAANGGSITPGEQTAINNFASQGQDILSKIGALVQTATTANAQGTAAQVSVLITQLKGYVNSFLADVNIKNSAHLAEYEGYANTILTDAQDIVALIPVFTTAPAGTTAARVSVTTQMNAKYSKAKSLKGVFEERLASLPKKIG
jgi:hypothetical protein